MGRVEKKTLRSQILQYRRLLSETEYLQRNNLLCERILCDLSFLKAQMVHLFLAMVRNREPDLSKVVHHLFDHKKQVIITRTDFKKKEIEHVLITRSTPIIVLQKGIPEPVGGKTAGLKDVDVILIPLLAFDKKGHRIGYGGGYYDRILSELPEKTKKIGISLTGGVDQFSFVETHDLPMDAVITPFETLEIK